MKKHGILQGLRLCLCLLPTFPMMAEEKPLISPFDYSAYSQDLDQIIPPQSPAYDSPLLAASVQEAHMETFLDHYIGGRSPWAAEYVQSVLDKKSPDDLLSWQKVLLQTYGNQGKTGSTLGYGIHYRPYPEGWIRPIEANMRLSALESHKTYEPGRRGIAVQNLACRLLPTADPHYFSHRLPGEGYPFDNLQNSALWAGTPVYVLHHAADKRWVLVLTPDFMGWVPSEGIALSDGRFVRLWREAVYGDAIAIISPETPIFSQHNRLLLTAYVGAFFPAVDRSVRENQADKKTRILLPHRSPNGFAFAIPAWIQASHASAMPMTPTPRNVSRVMKSLLGRPYGWGGVNFYNDCSAELKALYTPFGIYLPRNSGAQAGAGKTVDLASSSPGERIRFLAEQGKALRSFVFIGGHVMAYLGNASLGNTIVPMTFQNIWGLAPMDRSRRAVIGGSVIFPLLEQYPEDISLVSLAAKKYFTVVFLDEIPAGPRNVRDLDMKALILGGERE